MRPPTLISVATMVIVMAWTTLTAHGQISVGCFQNQLDSNTGGSDMKSYQDIYMSQGACTNYCKTSGSAYALTMDGSTCHCSNTPPLDSNKVDDSKCNKPCMGYPFEMCGGSSSRSIASVLLIGSSAGGAPGGGGSPSSSSPPSPTTATTAPAGSESSKKSSQNGSSTGSSSSGNNSEGGGSTTTTDSDSNNGGKAVNTNTGMFPPPRPTPTHEHEHDQEHGRDRDRDGRLKKETAGHLDASSDPDEDSSSESRGSSAGIIAASIAAVFGLAALFAFAFVSSKRRRQRLSQAAWTENMLLPSSLVHTSANDDELEGRDYTRSSPIYHQHPNKPLRDSIPTPTPNNINPNNNIHFPPPPALHPRQGGPLHMSQPSYPPPPPLSMMGISGAGGHYHPSMRGNPYQPYPSHAHRLSQQQHQQYDPHILIDQNLNHKEPLETSTHPPPPLASSFSRGPQSLQQPPLNDGMGLGGDDYERHEQHQHQHQHQQALSHHPSIRSIRHDRGGHQDSGGSIDSTANSLRVVNHPDGSFHDS